MPGIELYLGGGKLYFQKEGGEKVDMGVQTLTLTRDTTTKEAFTRGFGTKQRIAEVVVEDNFTLKGTLNNFSPEILEFVLGAKIETTTVNDSETLPNGETNSSGAAVTFKTLKAGSEPTFNAKMIFEGVPVMGKQHFFVAENAVIRLDSNLDLLSEDFSEISFTATLSKGESGEVYTHYIKDGEDA